MTSNVITLIMALVAIIICVVGIIMSIKFLNKQKLKYKEINQILKEKEGATFEIKNGLSKEEINNIDNDVNVDELMQELYNTYLELENRVKNLDNNLDDILIGPFNDFYKNKIENFKFKNFTEVVEGIDLINYSITEYSKEKLKFRITINCFSYKTANNNIVSGSNLEKIEQIILLSYEKKDEKWLISFYDKIYEKKLSE